MDLAISFWMNHTGTYTGITHQQPVIFFDGKCGLCTASVRFLLKHNSKGNLRFCSLQSDKGKRLLKMRSNSLTDSDSLLFIENNMLYESSTAVLKISAYLDFPYKLAKGLILVPLWLRDPIYKFIARNRNSMFGRGSLCPTDHKLYAGRFIH